MVNAGLEGRRQKAVPQGDDKGRRQR